jgi:putative restriction endonuclease
MYSRSEELGIRHDIFRWLDHKLETGQYEFTRDELVNYHFGSTRIPLLDRGRGIRNPIDFHSTLTIMTSFKNPYLDDIDTDLFIRYNYRANDEADNRKLEVARQDGDPLVYFQGIRPSVYVAYYPVYAIENDETASQFLIAMDESLRFFGDPALMTTDQRRYAERTVRARLHQPLFRARVMNAYTTQCAVCLLKHADLLDAAHIIPDFEAGGFATTSNGMALCKIHHAAFDRNLLGITPDYEVRIDRDLLDEIDGPMLRHGLQDMHGRILHVPSRPNERPSREALASRFAEFSA